MSVQGSSPLSFEADRVHVQLLQRVEHEQQQQFREQLRPPPPQPALLDTVRTALRRRCS